MKIRPEEEADLGAEPGSDRTQRQNCSGTWAASDDVTASTRAHMPVWLATADYVSVDQTADQAD